MVRRRADQAHARGGVTDVGDDLVNLAAGQFAPFAGLGALHNFNLDFVRIGQIPDRYAKTSRGDLLDSGALGIPVFHR